jgi:hypothetical protein
MEHANVSRSAKMQRNEVHVLEAPSAPAVPTFEGSRVRMTGRKWREAAAGFPPRLA